MKKLTKEQKALNEAFNLLATVFQSASEFGVNITWTLEDGLEQEFCNEFKKWCLKHGSLVGLTLKDTK